MLKATIEYIINVEEGDGDFAGTYNLEAVLEFQDKSKSTHWIYIPKNNPMPKNGEEIHLELSDKMRKNLRFKAIKQIIVLLISENFEYS